MSSLAWTVVPVSNICKKENVSLSSFEGSISYRSRNAFVSRANDISRALYIVAFQRSENTRDIILIGTIVVNVSHEHRDLSCGVIFAYNSMEFIARDRFFRCLTRKVSLGHFHARNKVRQIAPKIAVKLRFSCCVENPCLHVMDKTEITWSARNFTQRKQVNEQGESRGWKCLRANASIIKEKIPLS